MRGRLPLGEIGRPKRYTGGTGNGLIRVLRRKLLGKGEVTTVSLAGGVIATAGAYEALGIFSTSFSVHYLFYLYVLTLT